VISRVGAHRAAGSVAGDLDLKTVEILSIGDELLRGIVQESNSHWLAKRIAARGAALRRVEVLPDEPELVGREIAAALSRAPTLLITHGGLGPTDDDRTREAISLGTGRAQELNAEAEAIVRRRYRELAEAGAVADSEMTDERLRMARLPRGSVALDNQVGGAPALLLELGTTTLVALPGVPPELFWIWQNSLSPHLDELLGPGGFAETTFEIESRDESAIASILQEIQSRHRDLYIKSRAHGFGDDDSLRITVHATGESDAAARAAADAALSDLRAGFAETGISITDPT
jgi:molybdenum cofactor synthesis domain-containing protein